MKTISEHDYKIIRISKTISDIPVIKRLQNYLQEDYLGNIKYLNMYDIYKNLARTVVNVTSSDVVKSILINDIPETAIRNFFDTRNKFINEENLCNMLIARLIELPMRKDGKDLYNIKTKDRILSYDEYDIINSDNISQKRLMIDMDDVIVTNYF